jgi:hypothetical protein
VPCSTTTDDVDATARSTPAAVEAADSVAVFTSPNALIMGDPVECMQDETRNDNQTTRLQLIYNRDASELSSAEQDKAAKIGDVDCFVQSLRA